MRVLSSGNIQTTNITSTSINNTSSITSNIINSITGTLTNLSISNILSLLSNTPINFIYNGTQYNLSALMLYTVFQLSGASIASQAYVQTQISNLVNSSPDSLNVLSELAAAINNDSGFSVTMTNLIATKAGSTSNNNFTGNNSFTGTNTNISNLYSTILSVNNNNTRRSVVDIFEASMGPTSSYIYFNNAGTFGLINASDSSLNWYITLSGNATTTPI